MTSKRIDADTKLVEDPAVIKIVTVLDVVSLSILELLEYGISRDVSQSLVNEIIKFDKSALVYNDISSNFPLTEKDLIASGDYYFYNFLKSKAKLAGVGLYILETLRGELVRKTNVPPSDSTIGLQFHSLLGDFEPDSLIAILVTIILKRNSLTLSIC